MSPTNGSSSRRRARHSESERSRATRLEALHDARLERPGALGRLLDHYRPYLKLLARLQVASRLQKELDPSDVVQETYLDAARDFQSFRGTTEQEFVVWLKRLLAANVADAHRRYLGTQKRNALRESQVLEILDCSSQMLERQPIARGDSPSSSAARREQALRLAAAMERLRPVYQEVILLHHFHGLRFPQVAEQLGRTLDSVKNIWIRALIALKRQMGDEP